MDHPIVLLDYKGARVQIDKSVARLVQMMWDHGIDTTACCQGDPMNSGPWLHLGYVSFPTKRDLHSFLAVIGNDLAGLGQRVSSIQFNDASSERPDGAGIYFLNEQIVPLTRFVEAKITEE